MRRTGCCRRGPCRCSHCIRDCGASVCEVAVGRSRDCRTAALPSVPAAPTLPLTSALPDEFRAASGSSGEHIIGRDRASLREYPEAIQDDIGIRALRGGMTFNTQKTITIRVASLKEIDIGVGSVGRPPGDRRYDAKHLRPGEKGTVHRVWACMIHRDRARQVSLRQSEALRDSVSDGLSPRRQTGMQDRCREEAPPSCGTVQSGVAEDRVDAGAHRGARLPREGSR